jgi:hypothetical protein
MARFFKRRLWWRRPVKRVRGLVVLDAAPDVWSPISLPEQQRRSVPGAQGWGWTRSYGPESRRGVPSIHDLLDRYSPMLFGMQAARVPAPTAHILTTLRKELSHGFASPQD